MIDEKLLLSMRGSSFNVQNKGGAPITVHVPNYDSMEWPPKQGSEGFVFPINYEVKGKARPAVAKIFKLPSPERIERNRYLVREIGLVNLDPGLFDGAPFVRLDLTVGAEQLVGHIANWVGHSSGAVTYADMFERDDWTSLSIGEKKLAALQLARAVQKLEQAGVVHADLSRGNVMMTLPSAGQGATATIIDYDGYQVTAGPKAPPLLPEAERTFGTPGFQYPDLSERHRQHMYTNLFVESDRFALGILCCEIVAWSYADAEAITNATGKLQMELIPEDVILSRDLSGVDPAIVARWPEGFALLERALTSQPAAMPSPAAWIAALGGAPLADPVIDIWRYAGGYARPVRPAQLKSASGNLSPVSRRLAGVRFMRVGDLVELEFDPEKPLYVWDGFDEANGHFQPVSGSRAALHPGAHAYHEGWRFRHRRAAI